MKLRKFLPVLLAVPCWSFPAQAQTFSEATREVAKVLANRQFHSLAIREILDEESMARWPLSRRLEEALAEALTQQNPNYPILGIYEKAPGNGPDGLLKGTFQWKEAEKAAILSLYVQEPKTHQIIHQFKPIRLDGITADFLPATSFGRLVLTLNVPDALVFIDGKPVGKGAQTLPMPQGSHSLTVVANGYRVYDAPVTLKSGEPTWMDVKLNPMDSKNAAFVVESDVPGALVSIDGKEHGRTPLSISLTSGKHSVSVSKAGYRSYESQLDWDANKPQGLKANLVPLPGQLVVTADVSDAEVLVDGKSMGKAPLLLSDISVGSHQVVVHAPGYAPYLQDVSLKSQQTLNLRASLDQAVVEDQYRAIAVVPIQETPEDLALANLVYPSIPGEVISPDDALPVVRRLLDGKTWNGSYFLKLSHALKARQIIRIGVKENAPFERFAGFWPRRPHMEAVVENLFPNYAKQQTFTYQGGEPWGFGDKGPSNAEMLSGVASVISASYNDQKPQKPSGRPMDHAISLFYGGNTPRMGLSYEHRLSPFFSFGASYAYLTNQAVDTFNRIPATGPGEDILCGVAESHQGRLDALLRFDSIPPRSPYYEGAHWIPYLGVAYHYLADRYSIHGAGSKALEGSFWQQHHRGSALAGLKLCLGGTLLSAEVEYPVIYQNKTSPDFLWNLGVGWLF